MGLLQPLWNKYPGGRDALAKKVGTTGSTLSSINTGTNGRKLGFSLGRRLAEELGVSLVELGGPLVEGDERGATILGRLEAVEAKVAAIETAPAQKRRSDPPPEPNAQPQLEPSPP